MKLDRDVNPDGRNKYALINLRKLPTRPTTAQDLAAAILANPECVEFGEKGSENEFFAIKLKDKNALPALSAYAVSASIKDKEYAAAVNEMAQRSGPFSPFRKEPD